MGFGQKICELFIYLFKYIFSMSSIIKELSRRMMISTWRGEVGLVGGRGGVDDGDDDDVSLLLTFSV